jgi:hypothetical protein
MISSLACLHLSDVSYKISITASNRNLFAGWFISSAPLSIFLLLQILALFCVRPLFDHEQERNYFARLVAINRCSARWTRAFATTAITIRRLILFGNQGLNEATVTEDMTCCIISANSNQVKNLPHLVATHSLGGSMQMTQMVFLRAFLD